MRLSSGRVRVIATRSVYVSFGSPRKSMRIRICWRVMTLLSVRPLTVATTRRWVTELLEHLVAGDELEQGSAALEDLAD